MTAAVHYDELKEAISRTYPGLPKQLQLIARFALDKPTSSRSAPWPTRPA